MAENMPPEKKLSLRNEVIRLYKELSTADRKKLYERLLADESENASSEYLPFKNSTMINILDTIKTDELYGKIIKIIKKMQAGAAGGGGGGAAHGGGRRKTSRRRKSARSRKTSHRRK